MNQKLMRFRNIIVLFASLNFMMLTIVRVILYSELHLVYRSRFKMFLYGSFYICIILLLLYLVYYLVRPNPFDKRYGVQNITRRVFLTFFLLGCVLYIGSIMTRYVMRLDRPELERDGMIYITMNGNTEAYRDRGPWVMEYLESDMQ